MNKISKFILPLLLIISLYIGISSYNTLVLTQENVSESYSQIQSNLQRKLDLLPNLVKVVKAYASHEKELYLELTKLRSSATKQQQSVQEIQKLSKKINLSTLKLFAVAENYPTLRSSEQFLQLQSQIEGADNRINITRMQYNMAVKTYNANTKLLPSSIVAKLFGFTAQEYFKAQAKAQEKIELNF